MRRPITWSLLLLVSAGRLAGAGADLVLHNGKILSVDSRFGIHQAAAIRGGKIARVGSSRDVLAAERGPQTQVIDLHGRTVLPGLIDSHVHAIEAALSELRGPLPPLDSFAAVQAFIREQARNTPQGQWIVVPRTFPTRLKDSCIRKSGSAARKRSRCTPSGRPICSLPRRRRARSSRENWPIWS